MRPARSIGGPAAALVLAGALVPLGGCGADGTSGLPAPSPPTAVELAIAEHSLSGLVLPLPESWQVSEEGEGSWAVTARDPDAGDSPVLMVSAPMGTTDTGQAEQAGTALMAATVTDYRQSGVVSIGASVTAEATATGTPSPTAAPDGTGSSASQSAGPTGMATPSAGPSAVPGAVVRVTFTYSRGQQIPQGRAWIVPTSAGYVVVMLLDPSDDVAAPIERALEEAAA